MTIYEIDKALTECVDAETGEIIDFEKLDSLQMERDQKIESIACWYKDLVGDAAKIDTEIENLKKRREHIMNKANSLYNYAEYALRGSEFESARCSIGYRKSKSLNITDENRLFNWLKRNSKADCYKIVKETKISKSEVTKLIKAGTNVPYAYLEENTKMNIK